MWKGVIDGRENVRGVRVGKEVAPIDLEFCIPSRRWVGRIELWDAILYMMTTLEASWL